MQNIRQWFRNAVLVLAGVMLLAACGNPAKSDLQAIAKVFVETGYTPEKNQEYQQRLRLAQYFEKVPAGLNALSLKTDEGRSIRDDFSQGIDKLVRGAKQAIAAPAQDSQAQEAASRLALEGQQQFLQGQNKFIAAAGREGIKLNNK